MQNKPNLQKTELNVNLFTTKDYEDENTPPARKSKPKQTQFPKRAEMNANLLNAKCYENQTHQLAHLVDFSRTLSFGFCLL